MAAATPPDAWMERASVAIAIQGASDVDFGALTATIDISGGEKSVKGVALVNGGRVTQWDPQSDVDITLEAYPLYAGKTSGTTAKGFWDLLNTGNVTVPLSISNDYSRQLLRLAIMWTNDPAFPNPATGTTAANYQAKKLVFANAVCTSVVPSFTDGILKYTVKFTCVPFKKDATANFKTDSCEGATGSDLLGRLAAYTSSVNW